MLNCHDCFSASCLEEMLRPGEVSADVFPAIPSRPPTLPSPPQSLLPVSYPPYHPLSRLPQHLSSAYLVRGVKQSVGVGGCGCGCVIEGYLPTATSRHLVSQPAARWEAERAAWRHSPRDLSPHTCHHHLHLPCQHLTLPHATLLCS